MSGGAIQRWLLDDGAGDTYEFPRNPNAMTKLRAPRAISTQVTTAVDGQTLLFEAQRPPQTGWTFSGDILEKAHYDALDDWVSNKGRSLLTDHFNRVLMVVLTDFDAIPKRANGVYWRHTYTVTGTVFSVDESNAINP